MQGWKPCARGPYCRTARRDADDILHPGTTPWVYCTPCQDDIRRALDELPELYAALADRLRNRPRSAVGERLTTTRTTSSTVPIDLDVDQLMTNIGHILAGWEGRVRAMIGLPPAPTNVSWSRRHDMVARACATLVRHLPTLIGLPPEPMRRAVHLEEADQLPEDILGVVRPSYIEAYPALSGADAGREILYLHRRAEIVSGHIAPVTLLSGVACPQCGLMMLTRRAGEDTVTCGYCRHRISRSDYEEWTRHLAEKMLS